MCANKDKKRRKTKRRRRRREDKRKEEADKALDEAEEEKKGGEANEATHRRRGGSVWGCGRRENIQRENVERECRKALGESVERESVIQSEERETDNYKVIYSNICEILIKFFQNRIYNPFG